MPKTFYINIRCDEQMKDALAKYAEAKGFEDNSSLVRFIIRDWIKQEERIEAARHVEINILTRERKIP